MSNKLYGGIEAGGTKFVCAVGTSPEAIIAKTSIPTTTPSETLAKAILFFKAQPELAAIGIGSFGPLDLKHDSPTFGHVTTTPKAGWRNTDLVGTIAQALSVSVALNTDVNCAALGEQLHNIGDGSGTVAYMTVGTGIGIGYVIDGKIPTGITHTEMGHMMIPSSDTDAVSVCPYHSSCLEGLASGSALRKRWGVAAEDLINDQAWSLEASYLAYGIVNTIVSVMPDRIILGGGVMQHEGLLEAVQIEVIRLLNGYLQVPSIIDNIEDYIVSPTLADLSGVTGALTLAMRQDLSQ